jgi:nitrate reductase assembly molybdenum cofactor insertion protein NarJ
MSSICDARLSVREGIAASCRAFAALTSALRRALSAYYAFVTAFREAAEKLRAGERGALFPAGSFPPAMPFADG